VIRYAKRQVTHLNLKCYTLFRKVIDFHKEKEYCNYLSYIYIDVINSMILILSVHQELQLLVMAISMILLNNHHVHHHQLNIILETNSNKILKKDLVLDKVGTI
jgi:hypothetical protein